MKNRLALLALCLACSNDKRLLPNLSCFDAEAMKTVPVVYGGLTRDPSVPGGWAGLEVHFGVDSTGHLTARIKDSGDEGAAMWRADKVRYDGKRDSIVFTYVAAGNTKFTRQVRPTCDRLAGFTTYFRAVEDTSGIVVADTLPRVASR